MYNPQVAARVAKEQFRDARLRAKIIGWFDSARKRQSKLTPLEDLRQRVHIRGQRSLGLQTVLVSQIVGSEGRYADFDRRFLPLTDALRQRWSSVGQAMILSVELPPVELYKIGEVYFVRDGNHRISVARRHGQSYVDALVTELIVDVPVGTDLSVESLLLIEEYSDFLEWTKLAELRPQQRIIFSEPGGYLDLVQHINTHRYFLAHAANADIAREDAVTSWYDTVYTPIIAVIHELNVLESFPGRTEADLYRWIIEHRWYQRENTGTEPPVREAALSYAARFGRGSLGLRLRHALRRIRLPYWK